MMFAAVILLLCVFVCHQGTTTSCSLPTCEYNGSYYDIGYTFAADNCQYGYCNWQAQIEFYNYGCCEYNGTTYNPNESFMIDPCTYGYCDYGYVWQYATDCPSPPCRDSYTVEGECCPRCPDDYDPVCNDFNGNFYPPGPVQNYSSSPCATCYCPDEGGYIYCDWQDCSCAYNEISIQDPTQCCPQCYPLYC